MVNASRRERLRAAQVAEQKRRRVRIFAAIGVGVGALVAIAVMVWSSFGAGRVADRPANAPAAGDGIVVDPGEAKPDAPVVRLCFDRQWPHCGRCAACATSSKRPSFRSIPI